MTVWLHPLDDSQYRCLSFQLVITPEAKTFQYVDAWGNTVHHFNIPQQHSRLEIKTETIVQIEDRAELPERLGLDAWDAIDAVANRDFWHFTHDSHFVQQTELLQALAAELHLGRARDPLTTLRYINSRAIASNLHSI